MNRKKKDNGMPKGLGIIIAAIALIAMLPMDSVRRYWMLLTRHPQFAGNHPQEMIVFAGFFVLVVALIIGTFIVLFRVMGKKPAEREKPNPSARQDLARRSTLQTIASHIRQERRAAGDEAIHCAHLTGREKYMEQIDSFLRNGLIDRAEYNALRERYSKLNIPDDYHG